MVCFTVVGCNPLRGTLLPNHPEDDSIYSFGDERVTSAGANQLFDKEIEDISIERFIVMLDPDIDIAKISSGTRVRIAPLGQGGNRQIGKRSAKERASLEAQLQQALRKANNAGPRELARIQDYIIALSNQRCNVYFTYLRRTGSLTDGIFGSASVISGGAGAMFRSATAARILSGFSGIFSGVRGEINHALFKGQITELIIDNIAKARQEKLETIMKKRKGTGDVVKTTEGTVTIEGGITDIEVKTATLTGSMTTTKDTITIKGDTTIEVKTAKTRGTTKVEGATTTIVGGSTVTGGKMTVTGGTVTIAGGKGTTNNGKTTVKGGTMTVVGGTTTIEGATVERKIGDTLPRYVASEAIADAVDYHGTCSVSAGLAKMEEDLKKAENPSFKMLKEAVEKYDELRKMLEKIGKDSAGGSSQPSP